MYKTRREESSSPECRQLYWESSEGVDTPGILASAQIQASQAFPNLLRPPRLHRTPFQREIGQRRSKQTILLPPKFPCFLDLCRCRRAKWKCQRESLETARRQVLVLEVLHRDAYPCPTRQQQLVTSMVPILQPKAGSPPTGVRPVRDQSGDHIGPSPR